LDRIFDGLFEQGAEAVTFSAIVSCVGFGFLH
jgi:hypothetical protein